MTFDYDIGVIGGGAAGLTVTAGAARLGAKTLLVEKEQRLGGDCLHFGCVPSKTLIRSASVYSLMKHAPDLGLPEVDVPPADFRSIRARIEAVIRAIERHDSAERFCGLGARVEFGEPVFQDEHRVMLNGKLRSAKTWVIATGSSPAVPRFAGIETTPVLTNRELFRLDSLPRSMIVLGAGPVAVEMAQAFCRLGARVCVVQRSRQILSREDRDMADAVMKALSGEGVTFYLNASVTGMKDLGSETEVAVVQGDSEPVCLRAEAVLVATGRRPNLEGLGIEAAGLDAGGNGISVDSRMRTAQKHIFAAGDVTGAYQFTHAAGYEGGIVISNAIFHLPRRADYTLMPWCTYCEPELASVGMNEKRAGAAGVRCTAWTETFRENDRAQAEGATDGLIKMVLDEKQRPLGVQIFGPHAGEIINEWIAVCNGRTRLTTVASAVHPYPTLSEINKRVAGKPLSEKLFSERVKKGLKLFFNFKGRAGCD